MKRFIANLKDDSIIAAQCAAIVSFIFVTIELPIVWVYLLSRYLLAFVGGLIALALIRGATWVGRAAYRAIKNKDVS